MVILLFPLSLSGNFLPHQPRRVKVGGRWGSLQSSVYWRNIDESGLLLNKCVGNSAACAPADKLLVEGREWQTRSDLSVETKIAKTKAGDLNVGVARQGIKWGHRIMNECCLCLSHISSLWSLECFLQSPKLLLSQPLKTAFWAWGQNTSFGVQFTLYHML